MTVTVPWSMSWVVIGSGLKLNGMMTPLHLNVNTMLGSMSVVGMSATLFSDVAEVLDERSTCCQRVEGMLFESTTKQ